MRRALALLILLLALIAAGSAWAAPAIYFDSAKPSWYNSSLPPGFIKEKMIWEYGAANFSSVAVSSGTPSIVWSADTNSYILGDRSLRLTVSYGSGIGVTASTTYTVTVTAAQPLPSLAVRVSATVNAYLGSCSYSATLRYDYSDGTNQTWSAKGVFSSGTATYVIFDYPRSVKPVTKVTFSYSASLTHLLLSVVFNIEYTDYAYEALPLPGASFAVPARARFNSTTVEWWARFPRPVMTITPSADAWLDETHDTAAGSYTATLASYAYVYTLAQSYVLALLDSSLNSLASATGSGKVTVASDVEVAYLKLNSTLLYGAALLNGTTLAPPQSDVTAVTFTVQDYGAGYSVLQACDLQGRVTASGLITALGQAALNLTPYASYFLQVCKPGLCKAVGLVTVSSSNIQLTVMPSIPAVKPPSWVSASYDYANKQLVVNVSCASPPCSVNIRKVLANGTQAALANLTCNAQLCSYALSADDPYFLVTVSDSSGKAAQASTGLSAPIWESPLGSIVGTVGKVVGLDALGVNVNDLVVVLIGLGVIYAAFTFLTWEYAVLFLGVWLSVGTLLLGGSGRLVPPGLGLVVFGAVLSLLLKREREA